MTNRIQSVGKKLRRVGVNLWGDPKSPVNLRPYKPGMHGQKQTRTSNYALMLTEKQKIKYYYELSEKGLKKIFDDAHKVRTAANIFDAFMGILESRLQTFVYRMKWAGSMAAARQLVTHKHVLVNGRTVNIKSYRLRTGDIVTLSEQAKEFKSVLEAMEAVREVPEYIEVANQFKGSMTRVATMLESPSSSVLNPKAIVNLLK